MSLEPFILGVNYWPRRKAMYWWSDFDPGEIRDEFDVIRDLGLRLVRIFLLWEDFQPAPASVNPQALDHLGHVCDIALERELQLDVTFFTGHMSGPSWVPGWMLRSGLPVPPRVRQVVSGGRAVDRGYVNPFTDPIALVASELLLRTVVTRFKDHPAVGLWNLGNEPDLFAWPPTAIEGRAWVARMTTLIRGIDPRHPVACGLHMANLVQDNGLRVNDVFAEVDTAVMHGYPMYADWAIGPLDPDFVPFLCADHCLVRQTDPHGRIRRLHGRAGPIVVRQGVDELREAKAPVHGLGRGFGGVLRKSVTQAGRGGCIGSLGLVLRRLCA
jgi:hypothetical protein